MFDYVRKKAGLTPTDVAKLLGVSRVTASLWFNKRAQPHHLITKRVERLLAAIKLAVQANDLPPPANLSRAARWEHIREVLANHVLAQTPGVKVEEVSAE